MAMEGSLAGDGFCPSVGGPPPLPPLPPPPPPPLSPPPYSWTELSRKEKRKARKKTKRKQERQQLCILEEERLRDPSEQAKLRLQEATEAQTLENLKQERDLEEQRWREREQQAQEEAKRRKLQEEEDRQLREQQAAAAAVAEEEDEGGDWEYVEEGPAEIIWEGNEIIVKKRKVKVPKRRPDLPEPADDPNRPTSNPFAPATPAFADYDQKAAPTSMQDLVEQNPNFGTEQDKTHCPFHIKTGVCRFGTRCSRAHVYPDKSCTLLMKNMYSGPGLTWEHDEGLEYMDEEISQHFEEFYEDVHSEFLKFGEIVNFKVCKNASAHLRGNVYVHYRTIESAVSAYQAMNARFYAGKQISFEFVGVTRWKIAICGEYLKSRYQNCSHGLACNFLHCFRNPGGAYDWADWDGPPPRFWLRKMEQLFGGNKSKDSYRRKGDYKRPHKHGHSSYSTHDSKHWNGNSSCSEDEKRGRRSHSHKEEMQHWSRSHHQKYRSDSESSSSGSTRDRRGRQESQRTRKHHAERCYAETEERELERDGNSNHALRNQSCSRGKGRTHDLQDDDRWRLDVDTFEDANIAQCPRKERLSNGKLGSYAKRSHSSGLESDDNHEPRGNRRCRHYYEEDEDNRSRKDKKSSRRYQNSEKWSSYSGSHTQYSDDECALQDRSHRNSYEDENVARMRVSERSQRRAKENSSPGLDPQVSGKEYVIRHKTRLRNIHQNHQSHASELGSDLEISGDRREKPNHRHSYRRAGKRSSVSMSSGDEYVTSPKRPCHSLGKRLSPKRKIEDKRDLDLDVCRGE